MDSHADSKLELWRKAQADPGLIVLFLCCLEGRRWWFEMSLGDL
jgi:hypothetical protein